VKSKLTQKELRTAARYRALRASAYTLRTLRLSDDDCWVHEHPQIAAEALKIVSALQAKADKIEEKFPWVAEWEATKEVS
jgi:hypothetical protein